jgi:hypothetical protein
MLILCAVHQNASRVSVFSKPLRRKPLKKIGVIVLFLLISLVLAAGRHGQAEDFLCIFTVDPKILYMEAEGGRQEVTVTASAPGCTFVPRTAYSWIRAYSSEDMGRKVVMIEAGPASNLAQRVGSVMIGTTQVEVVQKARDHLNW